MTLKKIAICVAALIFATISVNLAQAGSKGTPNLGASHFAPGHLPPPTTGPGKSGNAPGDIKNDTGAKDAKSLAPGSKNPNKKK
jgi:hypothetical protein